MFQRSNFFTKQTKAYIKDKGQSASMQKKKIPEKETVCEGLATVLIVYIVIVLVKNTTCPVFL